MIEKGSKENGRTEPSPTKTVRFSAVVAACGDPVTATLWTRPEQDPGFSQAIRENRVLTVKPSREGSRTEFGLVGFWPGSGASFLLFPKALDRFADRKIIGIKYELTRSAGPVGRLVDKETGVKSSRGHQGLGGAGQPQTRSQRLHQRSVTAVPKEMSKSRLKRFRVTLRLTGEVTREVEANSAREAGARALGTVETPKELQAVRSKVSRVEGIS